jgi:hypothetical protein
MLERFSNSWALIKASWALLTQDKELLLFPLFSALAATLVVASFALPMWTARVFEHLDGRHGANMGAWLLGFFIYFCLYAVGTFFSTALVGAAHMRLNGEDPTVADGLRIARSRLGPILGYAALAATVGMLLKTLENRVGLLGRWIIDLFGIAFSVATYLAVPVLATRDVGPIEAVTESAALLKQTWGENVIVKVGLGWAFGWIYALIVLVGAILLVRVASSGNGTLAGLVLVAAVLGLALAATLHAALNGVYSAVLFRYATGTPGGSVFDPALLSGAFAAKR